MEFGSSSDRTKGRRDAEKDTHSMTEVHAGLCRRQQQGQMEQDVSRTKSKRTLVGVVEADALDDVTDNIVVVGLSSGGDLSEDVDHTGGNGGL